MEHPFFPTTTTRAEALRWLTIAEKLLSERDLMGSKSFATRARDSDPSLTPADQILAITDTLLAGERRIGNNQYDWYSILRVPSQQGHDTDLIANQYRILAILLNPQRNRFPLSEQAFRLVLDAWSVLSNPSGKAMYDKELAFYLQPQQQQPDPFSNPIPEMHQSFMFFGGSTSSGPASTPTPQPQAAAVHFSQAQVHANPQPQVDPVCVRSTMESQNFMTFNSGTNLDFGSGSGSKSVPEPANKQSPGTYWDFSGHAAEVPGTAQRQSQGQVNSNDHKKQQQQNYSDIDDKTTNDATASENAGDMAESREDDERVDAEDDGMDSPEIGDGSTMWTACPYCFYMYEYPTVYTDCTLRCQNCKKAFQAVVVPSPPVEDDCQNYFFCWGFLPMGFSVENLEKSKSSASTWTPFSPMYTCPHPFNGTNATANKTARKNSAPKVYGDDDDDAFMEVSDSSESDNVDRQKDTDKSKKTKNVKGKETSGGMPSKSVKKAQAGQSKTVNAEDGLGSEMVDEAANKVVVGSSKKGTAINGRKQPGRVVKNFGKLDLNVEFSNEPEESSLKLNQYDGMGRRVDENIEGIGFFEGLDEFLSSLPILNVVGNDKVVKAA